MFQGRSQATLGWGSKHDRLRAKQRDVLTRFPPLINHILLASSPPAKNCAVDSKHCVFHMSHACSTRASLTVRTVPRRSARTTSSRQSSPRQCSNTQLAPPYQCSKSHLAAMRQCFKSSFGTPHQRFNSRFETCTVRVSMLEVGH